MLLALRTQYAADASWLDRRANDVIRARLVTKFPHAGIVIGGELYHATAKKGPHKVTDWTPERWKLIEIGGDDQKAIEVFEAIRKEPDGWFRRLVRKVTKGYDFASLLAFVGLPVRDSSATYCYELCWLMRTLKHPAERVTPEDLLILAIQMRGAR